MRQKKCTNCSQCFNSNKVLITYQEVLSEINSMQSIQMPKEGSPKNLLILQLKVAFVIYAKFEVTIKKVEKPDRDNGNDKSIIQR